MPWDGDKEDYDDDGGSGSGSNDYSNWESSSYQFMQAMRNELPSGCTETDAFSDGTYYIAIKPLRKGKLPKSGARRFEYAINLTALLYCLFLPTGKMTLGVYTDSSCSEEADFSFSDYQSYAASSLTATASSYAFDTWNENMNSYKTRQPCRAYNREQTYGQDSSSRDRRGRTRNLGEEDDGDGDEEQNGYNCYDDAGYQK